MRRLGKVQGKSSLTCALLHLPCLRVFPTHVNGVVEVLEEPFASVEEAAADDVVVEKGELGAEGDVADEHEPIAVGNAASDRRLGSERRVAIHVLDVAGERRVRVVMKRELEFADGSAGVDALVHRAFFEQCRSAHKEADLAVRPEATVTHPSTEEHVASRDGEDGAWFAYTRVPSGTTGTCSWMSCAISERRPSLSSSSALSDSTHWPSHFSMAEFFCAANPFHASGKDLHLWTNSFAISSVRSVEPESTMTISSAISITLCRVRAMLVSSLKVIIATERFIGITNYEL